MNAQIIFWIVFVLLALLVLFMDKKYNMLRDNSILYKKKPFSYARTQLTWWTVIVLSSFITILLKRRDIPTFDSSTLILLGISSATTIAARLTDMSDKDNVPSNLISQNSTGKNFIIDILSDNSGVSIHRLQTVIFNIVIGGWFIYKVTVNLVITGMDINKIIPVLEPNNLILIGLSAGTYAALKTTENKSNGKTPPATNVTDTSTNIPPV